MSVVSLAQQPGQPGNARQGEMRGEGRPGGREQISNPLLDPAFWQGQPGVEAVKAAVSKGNSPSEMNRMSMDPVVLAMNAGAPAASVQYLLEDKGNPPGKLTHDGRTYLFWAAAKGNTAIMEYLLGHGAQVGVQDSHGMTPLTYAAAAGQQDKKVYDLLISRGANPKTELNADGANALLLSIGNDSTFALADYFQSKGLNLKSTDAAGNNAFDYAARSGNLAVMKQLLSKGLRPGNNTLLLAAQGSRRGSAPLEVYQYLEGLGVNMKATGKNGENALHYVVRRPNQQAIIAYFLEKGLDVNQADAEGNTALMNAAAFNRDAATVQSLLARVKDINQPNRNGATALALAVKGNSAEVVELLLNQGADLQATDAKGNNLVYYLFESYNPRQQRDFEQKLRLLQSKGLALDKPQADGNTVYHLAVARNDLSLVKLVQPLGADVNARNKEGLTALHKAAMISRNDAILQYLLSIGAAKDSKTSFNETAYDLARENELLSRQAVSLDFLK